MDVSNQIHVLATQPVMTEPLASLW